MAKRRGRHPAPGNDQRCLFPPRDNTTFANWMRLVVERYGPGGELWDQHPELARYALDRWQIWNEPNKTKFWACKPNPKAYVNLAREAAHAIHAVDPGATIIMAGAPREGKPGEYLRKVFKNGAKKVFDRFALHAYKKDADAVVAEVKKAREILADLGAAKWKLMITEFGWATGFPPGDHTSVTTRASGPADQEHAHEAGRTAPEAQDQFGQLLRVARRAATDDFGGGPDYWGLHTGLLRVDGSAKPALEGMAKASAAID